MLNQNKKDFVPCITVRYGANPYWRGYMPNWKPIRHSAGFHVCPLSPEDMKIREKFPMSMNYESNSIPLDRNFYRLLLALHEVTIFNVSTTEVSVECHEPFPGWHIVEPKVIAAIKSTLDPKDQEGLVVEGGVTS